MAQAAKQIGKTRGYMTRVLSGETTPSASTLEVLRMRTKAQKYPQAEERVIMGGEEPGIIERTRGKLSAAIDSLKTVLPAPVISWARGGEGAYYEDQGADVPKIYVPCKDPNCYVLQLEGDSMHPVFLEGDLLVVAPNIPPGHNDVVIVKTTEDQVMCKIMRQPRKGEMFEFHSYNPHHPPIFLRPDQIYRVSAVHSMIRPFKEKLRAMAVSESGHM